MVDVRRRALLKYQGRREAGRGCVVGVWVWSGDAGCGMAGGEERSSRHKEYR